MELHELLEQHEGECRADDPVRGMQQRLRIRAPAGSAGQTREQPTRQDNADMGTTSMLGARFVLPPSLTHLQKPRLFVGDKSDEPIRGWLTTMSHFLTTAKVPSNEGVGTAVNYLRGKAQRYWFAREPELRARGKNPANWEVFKACMVQGFGAVDPEVTARYKIDALKQTGSVEEYARELQLLFAELYAAPMSEADKLHKFFKGMKQGLAARVQLDPATGEHWQVFADAAQYAIKQDIAHNALNPPAPKQTPKPTNPLRPRPGALKKNGRTPWQLRQQRQALRDALQGRPGPSGPPAAPQGGQQQQQQQQGQGQGSHKTRCFTCDQLGHLARDCPNPRLDPDARKQQRQQRQRQQ